MPRALTGEVTFSPSATAAPVEPIVLPTPVPPARRPPLPIVATVVPVAAAGVLWLVTGSPLVLLFAALGPLIAVATMLDAARSTRRAKRAAAVDAARAREEAEAEIRRRHDDERRAQWSVLPDAGALLQRPGDVWRPATARADALVLGAGDGISAVRVVGGGDDAKTVDLRRSAVALTGVPVAVPLAVGVCVVGPAALAAAVARALVLQVCLTHPPGAVRIVGAPPGEDWPTALPHRRAGRSARCLAYVGPGQSVPDDVDGAIAVAAVGAPVPPRCGVVLTVTRPDAAVSEHGAERRPLAVEGLSRRQAARVAVDLAAQAPDSGDDGPGPIAFAELTLVAGAGRDSLAIPVGREREGEAVVDLVADGPHAVVAGVTGSGKSELLTTWIAGLCATRPPGEVCFLLADFKGGTAFDALRGLPHVTGVLTDLDGAGARRAMESLRAELRHREAELARSGARDIGAPGVRLPRLVVVVDEFAAVLADHPELHAVFTDVAARGRALGMHLVLGTQRVTGVVRDGLLANCPLRISLRVTDAADSRAVVGTEDAALLPGEAGARGLAFVRRAGDTAPRLTRIALTGPDDIARIAALSAGAQTPRAPWLPSLPARLPLERLSRPADGIVLGLADEPQQQRQPPVEIVPGRDRGLVTVGSARSGKSTLLALVEGQVTADRLVRIGPDPEDAWDALDALARTQMPGRVVLADDVDTLVASYPPDYASAAIEALERVVRSAGATGATVFLTAQRLSGSLSRVADLLPLRALLPLPSRIEHVSAGGDPGAFDPTAPPGRARLNGRVVQFALPPTAPPPAARPGEHEWSTGPDARRSGPRGAGGPPLWRPRSTVSALVVRGARAAAGALAAAWPGVSVMPLDDAGGVPTAFDPVRPAVIVGDPDGWQRHWSGLTRLRGEHDLVVSADCAADFRALTGRRELPPFCVSRPDRAWLVPASGEVRRVRLPSAQTPHPRSG